MFLFHATIAYLRPFFCHLDPGSAVNEKSNLSFTSKKGWKILMNSHGVSIGWINHQLGHSGKLTWQWKMDPLKSFEDVFPIENGDIPLLC